MSNNGDLLMIATNHVPDSDKIFRFENDFSGLKTFYTMKPVSSYVYDKINLSAINNNGDDTYFMFDYKARNIKRAMPELKTDAFVAGSGKNEIKDGIGLEASFGIVSKIISLNNVQYVIDNLYEPVTETYKSSNIRKLELINNQWKVTTLISTTTEESYVDITFDSKNNLYVIVKGKGIYKLNLQDNSLSVFKEGDFRMKTPNSSLQSSFGSLKMIKFKGKDLYLEWGGLIKISDYESKFAAAGK